MDTSPVYRSILYYRQKYYDWQSIIPCLEVPTLDIK